MTQAKLIKPNLRNLILQNLVFKLKTIVKNGLHSNHHKADHLQLKGLASSMYSWSQRLGDGVNGRKKAHICWTRIIALNLITLRKEKLGNNFLEHGHC